MKINLIYIIFLFVAGFYTGIDPELGVLAFFHLLSRSATIKELDVYIQYSLF